MYVFFKKSTKIVSLFFLVLFVSSTGSLYVRAADGGSVTYSGYVYDSGGTPIYNAQVRLAIDDDGTVEYRDTYSSGTGYYSVTCPYQYATPPVAIALSAYKAGYLYSSYGATVNDGSYTHNFYLEVDIPPEPSVGWVSPANGALITFTPSSNEFSFSYSAENIDYTRLYIGPAGSSPTIQFGSDWTNEGTSISKTVDIGSYMGDLHGLVRADLRAYVSSSVVATSTRNFNFSKQIMIESEMLGDGQFDFGSQLQQIIYDPPGDKSYSTYTTETKLVTTNTINYEGAVDIHVETNVALFNIGTGAKVDVGFTGTLENEWITSVTDIEELTSSLNSNDRDLVGPGYGDLYYGEICLLLYEIHATKITYSDNTVVYSDPIFYFGIDYSDSVLKSHLTAPASWLQANPNLNPSLIDDPNVVTWSEINSGLEGGTGYREVTHETTETTSFGFSFELAVSVAIINKLGLLENSLTFSFSKKNSHDESHTDSLKTQFHIEDDDVGDYLHYDVGTDKRYGTPIFRNYYHPLNPLVRSETSSPWEHNTIDYLPPEATYPIITYNTDGDSYSPSEGDTPLVELTLTDESNISVATLLYSHDDGAHWNTVNMQERLNNPNSWYANIPGHEHGTEVLWYIFTTDNSDNSKTVKDVDSNYFSYIVINRPCAVELLSPNGGGTYENSILIQWSGSDPDDDLLTYSIGYRISGGSWTQIATGLTDMSYLWDISGIADTNTVSVIVFASDGYGGTDNDESDFVFGIDNVDIPQATILSPLTSFSYQGIVTITWSTTDPDDYVTGYDLYYSVVSGTPNWILMEDGIAANVFTFEWNTSLIVYSTSVRLKIVVQNSLDETVETTTGIFTLDNRPSIQMNLINPNGGETFTTSCVVTWNLVYSNQLIDYQIKLEYSYNSSSWTVITSGITGTSYNWNTSALMAGTNYRLRITLTATYLGYTLNPIVDISENTFAIIKPVTTPTEISGVPIIITVIALATIAILPVIKLKKRN
ncbi:MAG: carboxypeptidase regulatory-like domain-containing protein [Candidatus Heimdallarchaeota archaeon]|nr:carboxypeptidase regulatory-like domain-containing protein [Candidatus Heimdallarchaeota archaeon]